jgi:arginine N-succinyltransferase
MIIIRPAEATDLDTLMDLANNTGGGLTSLAPDMVNLSNKVAWSFESFLKAPEDVGEDCYFMVMEETDTKTIMGTTAIFTKIGTSVPFYNYRLSKLTQVSTEPELRVETEILSLVNEYTGSTEIGTLFLHPDYRKGSNGRFLSKCRFMLMKAFPERFNKIVIAELRGWIDADGESPFWNAIGEKFFQMDFHKADEINGAGNNQFIGDMMPKIPIYTNLLPKEAQDVIGKPHDISAAALKLIKDEGFSFRGAVDIFDAGPVVEARLENIVSYDLAAKLPIIDIKKELSCKPMMIGNIDLYNYRMAFVPADVSLDGVVIPAQAAALLKVEKGDEIMVSELLGYKG